MSKPYILCVDDDKTILMSLKAQLKHHFGAEFLYEMAESADEAWEVINEIYEDGEEIRIVISDWLMPGTKGDELLVQIHERHPQIIKILLSGQAAPDAVLRAQNEAALDCHMGKPWVKEELYRLIHAQLAG